MLRALARLKNGPEARPGSMPALVKTFRAERLPSYAEVTRYDDSLMLDRIEAAMRDMDAVDIEPGDVMDLRNQWRDKPRTANKYHALLSLLMGLAIELRLRSTNPCRDVKKLAEAKRMRLLTDDEFLRIREGALLSNIGRMNPSGVMIQCAIDLAYLTAQRMGDIRRLAWRQVGLRARRGTRRPFPLPARQGSDRRQAAGAFDRDARQGLYARDGGQALGSAAVDPNAEAYLRIRYGARLPS